MRDSQDSRQAALLQYWAEYSESKALLTGAVTRENLREVEGRLSIFQMELLKFLWDIEHAVFCAGSAHYKTLGMLIMTISGYHSDDPRLMDIFNSTAMNRHRAKFQKQVEQGEKQSPSTSKKSLKSIQEMSGGTELEESIRNRHRCS